MTCFWFYTDIVCNNIHAIVKDTAEKRDARFHTKLTSKIKYTETRRKLADALLSEYAQSKHLPVWYRKATSSDTKSGDTAGETWHLQAQVAENKRRQCVVCRKKVRTFCVGCSGDFMCSFPCHPDHHRSMFRSVMG